ncbi:MAG: flavodoxin, partial [Dehalococcoidia bacterium]
MTRVLLIFDSRGGLTEQLAEAMAGGVRSVDGAELIYRRLDEARVEELTGCDALILGSPNWSGMTGKLKDWMDYSGDLWESGELIGKVGAAF